MRYLNWQRKCLITTFLIISSLLLVFSSITYANESKSEDSLKITTHNVYFCLQHCIPIGDNRSADLISKADIRSRRRYFNELFDKKHQSSLTNLQSQYPYQTPIVGKGTDGWQKTSGTYRKVKPVSGGVGIVSKWPIVEQEQHIYKRVAALIKLAIKVSHTLKLIKW